MPQKTFAVLGGDMRQAHLVSALSSRADNCAIYAMFLEKGVKPRGKIESTSDVQAVLPGCDVVILPLPLLGGDGGINTPLSGHTLPLDECLRYISPRAVAFAGKIPPQASASARSRGIELIDYLEREELSVLNALSTAEGAIEIALRELPITLFEANCMITGYGRIGKVLSRLLRAFGAKVSVVARGCDDLAWIRANGLRALHLSRMSTHLPQVDIIFNTVPEMLFVEDKLALLHRRCLIIDLASQPGGVDFNAANSLGLRTVHALSLPGKVAPESAGKIILDTIFNILHERGSHTCQAQP